MTLSNKQPWKLISEGQFSCELFPGPPTMQFWLLTLLLLATVKSGIGSCLTVDINGGYRINRFYRPPPLKKYISCQELNISSNFHMKIDTLDVKDVEIVWLEINNTDSPEISSGAFNTLNKLPDLRINGAGVKVIQPGAFDGLLNLTYLSLKNNKIFNLNENNFDNLSNLIALDLSWNLVTDINEGTFNGLKKLQRLFLQNNNIVDLPGNLFSGDVTKLEILDLSFNKLSKINQGLLQNLTNLAHLWLNNNNFNHFNTEVVSNNHQLQGIYLNDNFLTYKINILFKNSITILNCSHNLIQSLQVTKPSEIKILDLSANGISNLDRDFFKDLIIRDLYLDGNYLETLDGRFFLNFTTLELVSLSANQLKTLNPQLFKNNNKLKSLNLSKNFLTTLPTSLPVSLRSLNLNLNNFKTFMNLSSLINLDSLDLGSNSLQEITFHSLEGLKSLTSLILYKNRIQKIQLGCFRDLKILKVLDLSHNNITNLEVGVFAGINYLDRLDLSYNHLTTINEGIFHNLRYLKTLNIAYNNISSLSVANTITHFFAGIEIDLAGNNWTCSFLINIIKNNRITIRLKDGDDYKVTNVKGIACKLDGGESTTLRSLDREAIEEVEEKLTTNNSLLVFILLVMVLGLVVKYLAPYLKKSGKQVTVAKSEEELQLLN